MAFDPVEHWQRVYAEKTPDGVSWYQRSPKRSLSLISAHRTAEPCRVVDIGAGASVLADELMGAGGFEPWLVDVSERALAITRERLGSLARGVRFTATDITRPLIEPPACWADIWHDRAVLHFLTDEASVSAYGANLERTLKPGGTAIIATFAPDGPLKCSGLEVRRHDGRSVRAALAGSVALTLVDESREDHTTPWGAVQKFCYSVLRRECSG